MPINKTQFYVGEEIRIWGKITPVPYTKNIQLVRQYYCPSQDSYWWEVDRWTTCDDEGNYEFRFPAYIAKEDYCEVPKGGTQRWLYMVRAQIYKGEPPTTVEYGYWDVINMGPPPGTLRVFAVADSSQVTAEFTVDGQGPYVTPYVLQLSPKTYRIRCTYAGQTLEKEVTVESGKTVDVWFNFTLPPGTLDVHAYADGTEVEASVTVEGVGTYKTPFKLDVKPGTYRLTATYVSQTTSTSVSVESGKTVRVDFKFSLPLGTLELHAYYDSQEVSADVSLDNIATYKTPTSVMVKPGTYTLKATYGGQTQTQQVVVEPLKTVRVDFKFVRPKAKVTIQAVEGGTTEPAPGTYEYYVGDSVTVKAVPSEGYEFSHWVVDGTTRTENPITITVEKDVTLTANFRKLPPPPPPPPPPPKIPIDKVLLGVGVATILTSVAIRKKE